MSTTAGESAPSPPAPSPDPANPEPLDEPPLDPEKGSVPPPPGKSEHPKQ